MEIICMKCQNLFSQKNKKNINLSSAELPQRMVTCWWGMYVGENKSDWWRDILLARYFDREHLPLKVYVKTLGWFDWLIQNNYLVYLLNIPSGMSIYNYHVDLHNNPSENSNNNYHIHSQHSHWQNYQQLSCWFTQQSQWEFKQHLSYPFTQHSHWQIYQQLSCWFAQHSQWEFYQQLSNQFKHISSDKSINNCYHVHLHNIPSGILSTPSHNIPSGNSNNNYVDVHNIPRVLTIMLICTTFPVGTLTTIMLMCTTFPVGAVNNYVDSHNIPSGNSNNNYVDVHNIPSGSC